ncbi:hypothetical protein DL98DRAFT_615176 [Cadophora sp. DSE1049]|nr:hypothetical protein DL98DRAFT_615176 [Cadophora sp. DSE1049]
MLELCDQPNMARYPSRRRGWSFICFRKEPQEYLGQSVTEGQSDPTSDPDSTRKARRSFYFQRKKYIIYISHFANERTFVMRTSLTYLDDLLHYDEEKPFRLVGFPEMPAKWQTNCKYIDHENVIVSDARDCLDAFKLENEGFIFLQHRSKCLLNLGEFDKSGKNEPDLTAYLEESIQLTKETFGVDRVTCFDWRVRPRKSQYSVIATVTDTMQIRKNLDQAVSIPADDADNYRHYTLPPAANIHCRKIVEKLTEYNG